MPDAPVLHPPRRPSVRLLVLGWSLWLLVVWITLWVRQDIGDKTVRGLVFAAAMGMLAVWPALRLSQLGALGGVLLDWLALNALWQAVAWPMVTLARWPIEQVIWLSVAMAGWSLWVGWLIALGGLSHRGSVRAWVMAACILLLLAEPALLALAGGSGWRTCVSPVGALWALTQRPGYLNLDPWIGRISLTTAAAVGAWAMLLTARALRAGSRR